MPPEPFPWDRKEFFKERKHERSDSVGNLARCRDSSHHGSREFGRLGSGDYRRPQGHGKQGGWNFFPEESGHGYAPTRPSGDKISEDEGGRPSVLRGDGKYGRNGRENRGPISQREWRGHAWETSNGSPYMASRVQHDVNNDQRSGNDSQAYRSHPHSDFVWDQKRMKEQRDKIGGGNGLGGGQRYDKENSLNSIDWKPLKWTRTGSLSSRGSGFSHSSSSKSLGAVESQEAKSEVVPKNAPQNQLPSSGAAGCVTSTPPSEDTTSRKKQRLGWGEGLAKYEKKKVDGPDITANKDGPASLSRNTESIHNVGSGSLDKAPLDCASPATPSSVACSSSPGVDEKAFSKAAIVDHDINNICASPGAGSQNLVEGLLFNLEKLEISSIASLGSSIIEMLQSDDLSSGDSNFVRSTAMNKLLVCKSEISKALELTESEIDQLENELKTLGSENGSSCLRHAESCTLSVDVGKIFKEQDVSLIAQPDSLQTTSTGDAVLKMPECNRVLEDQHADIKDEGIGSPETATSNFVEPTSKEVSFGDQVENVCGAGNSDPVHSDSKDMNSGLKEESDRLTFGDDSVLVNKEVIDPIPEYMEMCSGGDDESCKVVLASNKEFAVGAHEEFNYLLPRGECDSDIWGKSYVSCSLEENRIEQKLARRKNFLKFKERAIALKFRIFQRMWKEDLRLLSVKKCRTKPQKKFELSLRANSGGPQKNRSSVRSHFPSTGTPSLILSAGVVNFANGLLRDSSSKLYRSSLRMPALILDEGEKLLLSFPSANGLVEDPCAVEKERVMINPWSAEEKEIFIEKLAAFGKDFRKIASFLKFKTTADCIEFYYKNHKSDCFERTRKKREVSKEAKMSTNFMVTSGKKWNRERNAASLDVLGAASEIAAHVDNRMGNRQVNFARLGVSSRVAESIAERTSAFDMLGSERETAAADVLANICGSLSSEAMSSCITSSVDPVDASWEWKCKKPFPVDATHNLDDETCSDESYGEMDPTNWTDEEKSVFLQAVSTHGKDFAMISRCVRTRSRDQCRLFYSKARKSLGLDSLHQRATCSDARVSGDDGQGGGSGTEDACVLEVGSVTCSDKSGSKIDEDLPLNKYDADHVETITMQANSSRAEQSDFKDASAEEALASEAHMVEDGPNEQPEEQSMVRTEREDAKVDDHGDSTVESGSAAHRHSDGRINADSLAESKGEQKKGNDSAESMGHRTCGNAPLLGVDRNSSGLSLDSEVQPQGTLELESKEKPCTITLPDVNPPAAAKIDSQDAAAAAKNEKVLTQNSFSLTSEMLQQNKYQNCDGQSVNPPVRPMNHVESSPVINGHLLHIPRIPEGVSLPKLNGNNNFQCVEKDGFLRKCSSTSPHHSVAELPLMYQKREQKSGNSRAHSRSLSDSEGPCRNGDVKLFGQILTNASSVHRSSSVNNDVEEKGNLRSQISNKSIPAGLKNEDGTSSILKFDNNYLGTENVPGRSYGFWDGKRIQTGYASLPDTAILLARYPAAFSGYSKMEQHPLQSISGVNEQNLNGLPVFPIRDGSSSNGMGDYKLYRSQDGSKVQPFTVDMKKRTDAYSEMQRNGFEASLAQQPAMAMVGTNAVTTGGLLAGGPCTGVSDPVAAIKMHYAKADKYGGQTGGIIREDESWRGKADIGR